MSEFPRALSQFEREIVEWLLPSSILFYDHYQQQLLNEKVIGEGRWGAGDLVLSSSAKEVDLTAGMTPVIAYGEIELPGGTLTVSFHEKDDDDRFEIQLGGAEFAEGIPDIHIFSKWNYSSWAPGERCPATKGPVREVSILKGNKPYVILAISHLKKTVWLHHVGTRFNQLLPVTGLFENVLRFAPSGEKHLFTSAAGFFEKLDTYDDRTLKNALLLYNQSSRKFNATDIPLETEPAKGLFARLKQLFRL